MIETFIFSKHTNILSTFFYTNISKVLLCYQMLYRGFLQNDFCGETGLEVHK